MSNWYIDWLLDRAIELRGQIKFFSSLSSKYETAAEISYKLKLELVSVIKELVKRKKQKNETKVSRR